MSLKRILNKLKLEGADTTARRASQLLLLAIILTAVAILIFLAKNWSSRQIIFEITVSGNEIINDRELISRVEKIVINAPKDSVNLKQIESLINQHPYIFESTASFKRSGELEIEVIERQPEAYYITSNGNLKIIDKHGQMLPFRKIANGFLPVISVRKISKSKLKPAINDALKLINVFKDVSPKFLYNILSEIIIGKNGSIALKLNDSSGKFIIGSVNNIENKLYKLEVFLKKRFYKGMMPNFNYVDLRWKNQVVIG